MTAQIGKNHLGDRNEFLPTVRCFEESHGNLYAAPVPSKINVGGM
jgi:arylsulfatase